VQARRKAIVYPHPDLEPILRSTYGSIVYQEQVMQIAQVYAGYSLGGADLLRRAMGKKQKAEMDQQKETFVSGAVGLGRDKKQAEELFDQLAFFAGYGFNKSHSAAYGLISYFTAWLKAHHRAEYMSALMTIDSGNTDKVLVYIGDCRRAGLEILPPDINESVRGFDVPADNRKQDPVRARRGEGRRRRSDRGDPRSSCRRGGSPTSWTSWSASTTTA
jgi:DNA polymerase-3 subunit alpha